MTDRIEPTPFSPSNKLGEEKKQETKLINATINHGGFLETKFGIISKNEAKLYEDWGNNRRIISQQIGDVVPKDSKETGSFYWTNTAKTSDELFRLADKAKNNFLNFTSTSAGKSGRIYCGENNKYLVKSKKSLDEKITRLSQTSWYKQQKPEKRLPECAFINDTLRSTIIVKTPEDVKEVITNLKKQCAKEGHEIAFSDKFQGEPYPDGYVGIHAKIKFKYFDPDSKENHYLVCEIQIHFDSITDGSENCPHQLVHSIYEKARKGDISVKEQSDALDAQKLIFTVALHDILKKK